jgi:hypothetical protein
VDHAAVANGGAQDAFEARFFGAVRLKLCSGAAQLGDLPVHNDGAAHKGSARAGQYRSDDPTDRGEAEV